MMDKVFEDTIEKYLIDIGGYKQGNSCKFDFEAALDKDTLLSFIKSTQAVKWRKYCKIYLDLSEEIFINRLCSEIDSRGLLDVLRKGFKDRSIEFKVCYFKPETSINIKTTQLYNENILHCTRELKYSVKDKSDIDIVLLLNGIPIVSIELKHRFDKQYNKNILNQYKFDRENKYKIFDFRNRVLVHFAVDFYEVYMTTHLNGDNTYFLPFNQGSNGAGNIGGKGNPYIKNKYQTSYLWEQILCKDKLMEILYKYMHLQKNEEDVLIFPRYHQLDVVTKLLASVKRKGVGKNYLIQHSTGSGKSNSIAWLAHRLSGLHNLNDEKIFHSIIIVTDRKVLDNQLQDIIYQFDHVSGVVECIDDKKHASDLKNAINLGKQIIITTLQKFPLIYDKVESDKRNFAVIIDEAHSSQSGESSKKLKMALGNIDDILEEYKNIENEEEINTKDYEDEILEELSRHSTLSNISFFAFTATPKEKTLQLFGEKQLDGTFKPFHVYSIKQAIEEGFILDVLQNYSTYKMYYEAIKKVAHNYDIEGIGVREVLKCQSLNSNNIIQKTIIMVEHFKDITLKKIGGKAKAMVVAPSRLHAVCYFFYFKNYIEKNNYKDINVLVSFSSTVKYKGVEWTEEKLNKTKKFRAIKSSQLKEQFHTDDFNILIVAEKYQTGFDEPFLHTMFIDKKLSGLKAIQTLSRLNRTLKGKTDTFILDFVNKFEDIKDSFEPYYKSNIVGKQINLDIIYSLKIDLDKFLIYRLSEIKQLIQILYTENLTDRQTKLLLCLKPALDKFQTISIVEEKKSFCSNLMVFIKCYSFMIQICRPFDIDMQEFFIYSKFLLACISLDDIDELNLIDKVKQVYYELTFEESIIPKNKNPNKSNSKTTSITRKMDNDKLSFIIDKMNEYFGTSFTKQDKVLEQIKSDFTKDKKMIYAAKSGDPSLFKYLYEQKFQDIAANCYEENNKFFISLFSDELKMEYIMNSMKDIILRELNNIDD